MSTAKRELERLTDEVCTFIDHRSHWVGFDVRRRLRTRIVDHLSHWHSERSPHLFHGLDCACPRPKPKNVAYGRGEGRIPCPDYRAPGKPDPVNAELNHVWVGGSGLWYTYVVVPIGALIPALAGVYIFARQIDNGTWDPVYIGETANLRQRLTSSHEQWTPAAELGATHLHISTRLANENEYARLAEESDLLSRYRPPCNGDVSTR